MFRRRAHLLFDEIRNKLLSISENAKIQLSLNPEGPGRRGSFEVSVARKPSPPEERILLWSGVGLKPRIQKFPKSEKIIDGLKRVLGVNFVPDRFSPKRIFRPRTPDFVEKKNINTQLTPDGLHSSPSSPKAPLPPVRRRPRSRSPRAGQRGPLPMPRPRGRPPLPRPRGRPVGYRLRNRSQSRPRSRTRSRSR